jgi:hypothetical protein
MMEAVISPHDLALNVAKLSERLEAPLDVASTLARPKLNVIGTD